MRNLVNIASVALLLALPATVNQAAAQSKLFGYISPIAAQPLQQITGGAMEKSAEATGWTVRVLDSNLSADRQVGHIDTLLTLGAKAISIEALDENAIVGAVARAKEQGVPIVGVNSKVEGMTNTVWWDLIACREGLSYQEQAEWIAKHRPGAKVVMMGGPNAPSLRTMTACFRTAAEKAGLSIVNQVDNLKDSSSNASALAADVLIRNPDATVFWAYNDVSALGISAAVLGGGKQTYSAETPDGIMIFGANGDADAIAAIRQKRITGTFDPDTYSTGLAIFASMKQAAENPGAPQKDMIVKKTFFNVENIDTYVPSTERGSTLENLPLVQ